MTKQARQASKSRSALRNVRPSDVGAMETLRETDPETMAALVTMVALRTMGEDPDVGAYAGVIAPALWENRRNDAPLHAVVAGAVRIARREVALAHGDELREWDLYGDMTELALVLGETEGDARTSLSHYGTAPSDARWEVTPGDVVVTAIGQAPESSRVTLRRLCDEYLSHESGECCHDPETGAHLPGRRVTLKGITAHLEGWNSRDHSGLVKASHRAATLTLRDVPAPGPLMETYGRPGERPTYGRNSGSGSWRPKRHDAPKYLPGRPSRTLPETSGEVVRNVVRDWVWVGPWVGAGNVDVWDRESGSVLHFVDPRHHSGGPVDALGYPVALGYGESVAPVSEWTPVMGSRVETWRLPEVTLPGVPQRFGPGVVVRAIVRDALGYPASLGYGEPETTERLRASSLTDDERQALREPLPEWSEDKPNGRMPLAYSGDAPESRPDDAPLRGDVTASGILRTYKPVVSPRKRVGAQTGPVVPMRPVRETSEPEWRDARDARESHDARVMERWLSWVAEDPENRSDLLPENSGE